KLLVGFAPGGGNDILARLMAEQFQKRFGQPFIVENRSGASGMIAIGAVKNAPPDGYTLLVGPSSGMAVNPALFAKINYDPVKDFKPISIVGDIPMIVTVNSGSKAETLRQFIEKAKNSAAPLYVGSAATSFQLAGAVFANKAGIKLENVNYRGSSQVVTALLANEVDVALIDAAAAIPQIRAGKLRALAVTGNARFSQLPDIPTAAEAGVPGFVMSFWSALFAPAGTPDNVVSALQSAVKQGLAVPEVAQRMKELGIEPVGSTSAELANTLAKDLPTYKDAAKLANVRPE
ncbi:MAG: Bug family tripartite tricarboxylate transporter substrate binding protein, partial [Noviherbaspirillum sp.]